MQVLGPTLIVTEGQTVTVTLINNFPAPPVPRLCFLVFRCRRAEERRALSDGAGRRIACVE